MRCTKIAVEVMQLVGRLNKDTVVQQIREGEAEIRRLHARIHEKYRDREKSDRARQEWRAAGHEFHSRYSELAFPGGLECVFDRIREGDETTIETALIWLEVRPYFFRSGYHYKDILRSLRRAPKCDFHATWFADIDSKWKAYRASVVAKKGPPLRW